MKTRTRAPEERMPHGRLSSLQKAEAVNDSSSFLRGADDSEQDFQGNKLSPVVFLLERCDLDQMPDGRGLPSDQETELIEGTELRKDVFP